MGHLSRRIFQALCLTLGLLAGSSEVAFAFQDSVFWADLGDGTIKRVDLAGGTTQVVLTGLGDPIGVAVDPTQGKLYWTEFSAKRVSRANLDGTDVEILVSSGLNGPAGIALDLASGRMIWTDPGSGAGRLLSGRLDGSDVQVLIGSGLIDPVGVALDLDAGKVYWAEYDGRRIQRCNLDGSGFERIVDSIGSPSGLDLDRRAGKIYWADPGEYGPSQIQRADLDGSNVEFVRSTDEGSTIALDPIGNRMVFSGEVPLGEIRLSTLDGTGASTLSTSASAPGMAALDLASPGIPYCTATPNSTGLEARIRVAGSASISANELVLVAGPVPNQPGIFYYGPGQIQVVFGNGFRCVGGQVI